MRRRFAATAAWGLAVLLVIACARPAPSRSPVVAEIDGTKLTVDDVRAYLDANLLESEDDAGDPEARGEREDPAGSDAVRSRLFDDFIDGQVLALEAERRGIQVGDEEVDAYLRAGSGEPARDDAARREAAVRELRVQKLRERWVRGEVSVTPDEVDAYLSEHRAAMVPGRRLTLRSLKLADAGAARAMAEQIARKRLTFEQAAAKTGGEGAPLEVDLSSLPDEVRAAVAGLGAGQVSDPVSVQGAVYLFRVDGWAEGVRDDEETWRRRATDAILRKKYEEASRSLVREVKRGIRVRLDTANLPFRYVPEAPL
jgi:parvulin-like peptidyl-prolyl isomerase